METSEKNLAYQKWVGLLEEFFVNNGLPLRLVLLLHSALDADADWHGLPGHLGPNVSNWVRIVLANCDPSSKQSGKWYAEPKFAKAILAKGFHVYFSGPEEALKQLEAEAVVTNQSVNSESAYPLEGMTRSSVSST